MIGDPLKPDVATLVALGSIVRHAEELLSRGANELDAAAIAGLLAQPNVQQWLYAADAMALPPVKRGS